MALIQCKECEEPVSTEAGACPHCGAPQRSVPPPIPVQPPIIGLGQDMAEEQIYADGVVTVTTARVMMSGATYVLRNVTSVKMLFTPPRMVKPILLLIVGLMILLAAFLPINENAPAPASAYVIAGLIILGAILWMCSLKTKYHVGLSTSSGEIHALTSQDKSYIQRVVQSINTAIVRSNAALR